MRKFIRRAYQASFPFKFACFQCCATAGNQQVVSINSHFSPLTPGNATIKRNKNTKTIIINFSCCFHFALRFTLKKLSPAHDVPGAHFSMSLLLGRLKTISGPSEMCILHIAHTHSHRQRTKKLVFALFIFENNQRSNR